VILAMGDKRTTKRAVWPLRPVGIAAAASVVVWWAAGRVALAADRPAMAPVPARSVAFELSPTMTEAQVAGLPLPARLPIVPRLVNHGARAHRLVALTFDGCSTPPPVGFDAGVIAALVTTRTPATLFLGGRWMLQRQDRVRELAAEPLFELGLHGFRHPHMTEISDAEVRRDLDLNRKVLWAVAGRQAAVFRPPFGEVDDRVVRLAAEQGLVSVNFDVPGGDSDRRSTAPKLIEWIERKGSSGTIVVLHMNGRGWHTAEALPGLVAGLRARGYMLVTVSELLRAARPAGQSAWGERRDPPAVQRLLPPLLQLASCPSSLCGIDRPGSPVTVQSAPPRRLKLPVVSSSR